MRRDHQRLVDILDALDSLARMIDGRTESEFLSNETLCYAVAQEVDSCGRGGGQAKRRDHGEALAGALGG